MTILSRNKSFNFISFHVWPVPIPDDEKKLTSILIVTLLCGASKDFIKVFKVYEGFEALKGFMKAFLKTLKAFLHKTFWGTTKKCENKNLS